MKDEMDVSHVKEKHRRSGEVETQMFGEKRKSEKEDMHGI